MTLNNHSSLSSESHWISTETAEAHKVKSSLVVLIHAVLAASL